MNYLVTGGAGFIGSNLVDRLLELRHSVVVVDDFSSGKKQNLDHLQQNKNLKVYKESITNNLHTIFKKHKFDAIFHLAAIPRVQFSIRYPERTNFVNISGTLNLLLTAKKFNVKRFVFSSSSSVYGDQETLPLTEELKENPMSPYALQKLVGERYCRLFNKIYGLQSVSLRYFNVYGPRQDPNGDYACLIPKFIYLIAQNKIPTINGDGNQTRDFTYVSDVVDVNIKAATTKNAKCFGEALNVGASNNISVNEVASQIKELSNSNIRPIHGPAVIEPRDTKADISKAKNLLGYSPKMSFSEGLKKTYQYLKRN